LASALFLAAASVDVAVVRGSGQAFANDPVAAAAPPLLPGPAAAAVAAAAAAPDAVSERPADGDDHDARTGGAGLPHPAGPPRRAPAIKLPLADAAMPVAGGREREARLPLAPPPPPLLLAPPPPPRRSLTAPPPPRPPSLLCLAAAAGYRPAGARAAVPLAPLVLLLVALLLLLSSAITSLQN